VIRIESISQIQEATRIIRNQKKGFYTNLFFDLPKFQKWIDQGIFYSIEFNRSIIFLKESNGFKNLYFTSADLNELGEALVIVKTQNPDDVIVSDIVGEKEGIHDTVRQFQNAGFNTYTVLMRMSRQILCEDEIFGIDRVRYAVREDLPKIRRLLETYFDPIAEQIPEIEKINDWADNNRILVSIYENEIIGFVIYEIGGLSSYLRYWFVHPLHRDKKIGSDLIKRFFYESRQTRRQYFWVIEKNENAIMRYRHYGFRDEEKRDYVLINNGRYYEG